jgi:uncharacterized protein (DUF2249 family)
MMNARFHPVQSEVPIVFPFDARGIARRFRHAATFAALDLLRDGETMRFVNDHDPLPLLAEMKQRYGSRVAVRYVERAVDRVVVDFERT